LKERYEKLKARYEETTDAAVRAKIEAQAEILEREYNEAE